MSKPFGKVIVDVIFAVYFFSFWEDQWCSVEMAMRKIGHTNKSDASQKLADLYAHLGPLGMMSRNGTTTLLYRFTDGLKEKGPLAIYAMYWGAGGKK